MIFSLIKKYLHLLKMETLNNIQELPCQVTARLKEHEIKLLDLILQNLGPINWSAQLSGYLVISEWELKGDCVLSSWSGRGSTAAIALSIFLKEIDRHKRPDGFVICAKHKSGTLAEFERCMIHPVLCTYMPIQEESHVY